MEPLDVTLVRMPVAKSLPLESERDDGKGVSEIIVGPSLGESVLMLYCHVRRHMVIRWWKGAMARM